MLLIFLSQIHWYYR